MTELIPLDDTESARLAECERKIRDGLQTFVEVGRALADSRDGKLYRQTHETFEAYCGMEFGLTRKRAYDLMGASDIIDALAEINGTADSDDETQMSPIGDIPIPATESQARELSGLPAETAAQVMRTAADLGDRVTASSIRAARDLVSPRPTKVTETEPTTTEFAVEPTTGEVIDAGTRPASTPPQDERPVPAPEEGVQNPHTPAEPSPLDDIANDSEMKRLNYQAALARAIKQAGSLPAQFNVADVARIADPQQIESLTELAVSIHNFVGNVRKQRGAGLRLVGNR
jgi:hypothetical protein